MILACTTYWSTLSKERGRKEEEKEGREEGRGRRREKEKEGMEGGRESVNHGSLLGERRRCRHE